MKRFIFLATVMVAVGGFATAALAVPPGGNKGQSTRATQTLICKDGSFNAVFPCGLPEDFPDPEAGSYGTGNAFGQIKYDTSAAGGNETMHLILHGLQANTWYLVTMQHPAAAFSTNGATCLFDVKIGSPPIQEFCDVALVKTNDEGNANALIPTDSGLTGDTGEVCENGNVPGLSPVPDLGSPSIPYIGVTMVVKNVGAGGDRTAPNCTTLIGGGSAELFEQNVLPTFTAP